MTDAHDPVAVLLHTIADRVQAGEALATEVEQLRYRRYTSRTDPGRDVVTYTVRAAFPLPEKEKP